MRGPRLEERFALGAGPIEMAGSPASAVAKNDSLGMAVRA